MNRSTSSAIVAVLALALALLTTSTALGGGEKGAARAGVAVAAAFHEGRVTFSVDHPQAASMQVQVFADHGEEPIFDSGVRPVRQVLWPTGAEPRGGWRWVVKAWDAEGALLTSQVATAPTLDAITEISFDTVPAGATAVSPAIGLQGPVDVGTSKLDGRVWVYRDGAGNATLRLFGDLSDRGGGFDLWDEAATR